METIVVLPTLKEEENLSILIPKLLHYDNLEVLVIDDCSLDNTDEVINTLNKKFGNRVQLVKRSERGRATAGLLGFKIALQKKPKYIIEMDADLSHNPIFIKDFLKEILKYDMVLGSRFIKGGKDTRYTRTRQLLSQISRRFYKILLNISLEDIGSGFKCYRTDVINRIVKTPFYSKTGTSICMEINFKVVKFGYKIKEIPIIFEDRKIGQSKLSWKSFIEPLFVGLRLIKAYGRKR